jgi:hypothetical protein
VSDRWVRVSLPSVTLTVCVRSGHIADGPPYVWSIVRRLRTAEWRAIARYLQVRGAVFAELPPAPGSLTNP